MSDTTDAVSYSPIELKPYSRPGGPARPMTTEPVPIERKPPWLTVKWQQGENYRDLKGLVRGMGLHTVCEEAHCPNISECWENRTATFLILGDTCTRSCGFCAIKTGRPNALDKGEPERVARAIETLQLKHAVITSVNRDELPDGGAEIFAETIKLTRDYAPDEFKQLKAIALEMGFKHVESGPLVRSSYHAHEQVQQAVG